MKEVLFTIFDFVGIVTVVFLTSYGVARLITWLGKWREEAKECYRLRAENDLLAVEADRLRARITSLEVALALAGEGGPYRAASSVPQEAEEDAEDEDAEADSSLKISYREK